MSALGLEAVGIGGVPHGVHLAIVSGVGVRASGLDAVGFDTAFLSLDTWKKGEMMVKKILIKSYY